MRDSKERIIVHPAESPAKTANELLNKTIATDGTVTLPIDIEDIARQLGIEVQRLPLAPGTDGLLVKDRANEWFKAIVDAYAHPHRARFTLAHEIGHYIKDYQYFPDNQVTGIVQRRDETSSRGTDPKEVWANQFAASLLMPAGIVARLWGDNLSEEDMADVFNVSKESLNHRLENLGLK